MDGSGDRDAGNDDGLVLMGAPATTGQIAWPVMAVLVVVAFAMGTGTGYGIGHAPDPSPTPHAPAATATPAPTSVQTTAPIDDNSWPWLEGKLPDSVAGRVTEKSSGPNVNAEEEDRRRTAEQLATACDIDPSSVAWAFASWEDGRVEVFFVPAECPAPTLIDAYHSDFTNEMAPWVWIKVGDEDVKYGGGGFFGETWLYARTQMLYVIRGPWAEYGLPLDDSSPPPELVGQHPIVTEILAQIR